MSVYYEIKGLKVRVSDHEPNFSMDRFRGKNDIELYTKDACNNKLDVCEQIMYLVDMGRLPDDFEYSDFREIYNDYDESGYYLNTYC